MRFNSSAFFGPCFAVHALNCSLASNKIWRTDTKNIRRKNWRKWRLENMNACHGPKEQQQLDRRDKRKKWTKLSTLQNFRWEWQLVSYTVRLIPEWPLAELTGSLEIKVSQLVEKTLPSLLCRLSCGTNSLLLTGEVDRRRTSSVLLAYKVNKWHS